MSPLKLGAVSTKTLLQSLALVGISCIVGLLVNQWGPALPIFNPYKPAVRVLINLRLARPLLNRGQVVFVDVRAQPKELIPGAIHITGAPAPDILKRLQDSPHVICYGEDENDEDAAERVAQLQQLGVTRIFLLAEGWRGWKSAGYPTTP